MASPLTRGLDVYLAHLTVERGLSRNTVAAYRRDLGRYVRFLGGRDLDTIGTVRENDIADFVEALADGSDGGSVLTASSSARALAAVRGWHRFAVAEGWVEADPSAAVSPPAAPRRLPKAISVEQVGALLAAAGADSPRGLRDRALLELLYGTGARISEAVGLDVDDLDLEDGRESVRLFGKGSKERVVPVGSYATAALSAYLVRGRPELTRHGRGTTAVFVNQRGTRLSRQSAWTIIQRAAETAGLTQHVSPHTLRHSFATHLVSGGADVRVVQDLLGHASVTTTQVYTMVTPETLREVYTAAHPRALRARKAGDDDAISVETGRSP